MHLEVYYDRIANRARDLRPSLLAYVVVHEITHVLQAIDRHSDSGIMKGQWDSQEYALMRGSRPQFAEQDVELIHEGIAAREARRASGTLRAKVHKPEWKL